MDVVMERDRVQYLGEGGNVLAEVTFPQVEPGVAEINHTFVDESLRGAASRASLWAVPWQASRRAGLPRGPRAPMP